MTKSNGKFQCKICDTWLGRITGTHLKKHNLTLPEYRKKYGPENPPGANNAPGPGDFSPEDLTEKLMGVISHQITHPAESVPKEVSKLFDQLLQDQDAHLRVSLNVQAVVQMAHLVFLTQKKIEVMRELLSTKRLKKSLTEAQLIRTARLLDSSVKSALDFLKSMSMDRRAGLIGLFDRPLLYANYDDDDIPETPQGRERIRSIMNEVLGKSRRTDPPNPHDFGNYEEDEETPPDNTGKTDTEQSN